MISGVREVLTAGRSIDSRNSNGSTARSTARSAVAKQLENVRGEVENLWVSAESPWSV